MSVRKRQIPDYFTYMWNVRNKRDEHRGKKKREANQQKTLNYREQTEFCWRGSGWGDGLNG